MIWNYVLVFMAGVVITLVVIARFASGILKVYVPDDPDEQPYLYVELGTSVGSICRKKYVLFRVDAKNLKTQK